MTWESVALSISSVDGLHFAVTGNQPVGFLLVSQVLDNDRRKRNILPIVELELNQPLKSVYRISCQD